MKNSNRAGLSLIEIILATLILGVAILGIYRALSASTEIEIETTKIAMSKEILAALRQEVLSHTFEDIHAQITSPSKDVYADLIGEPYPETLAKILVAQKKYKDFKLVVKGCFTNDKKTIAKIEGTASFTGRGNKERKEVITFLQVSEK